MRMDIFLSPSIWYSSANTLRIQRLEFGREKLTKGPDVIRQACCHRGRVLSPSGTNRPMVCALLWWQRLPQAHVRSGHVVEGLEEDHPLPHALAIFTETGRLTGQRCQGLTQGQVHQVLRDAPGFSHGEVSRCLRSRQSIWCSPQGWDTPGFSHGEEVTRLRRCSTVAMPCSCTASMLRPSPATTRRCNCVPTGLKPGPTLNWLRPDPSSPRRPKMT